MHNQKRRYNGRRLITAGNHLIEGGAMQIEHATGSLLLPGTLAVSATIPKGLRKATHHLIWEVRHNAAGSMGTC
jgi:hypothetical protein